ncbi:MAG: ligD [Polaromonas sp.]|nr:ligD [Polaromonas sp.]
MADKDPLEHYRSKRNFAVTPEPKAGGKPNARVLAYVVQKHWASRLHYDFRLELEGTLKSWAVPKGPSLDPQIKRMAVQVEDHPLAYGNFEGTIPPKQYGAGEVIVWDRGTWTPLEDAAKGFRDGKLKFELHGEKLRGKWALVRMRGNDEKQVPWLLIKEHDGEARAAADYDITEALPDSVLHNAGTTAARPASKAPAKKSATTATHSAGQSAGATALPARTALPETIEPQLATLVDTAPEHGDWLYELKFDGYRLMSRLDGGHVACITRNGHDWTARMPHLAKALASLGLDATWLDGEIIVPNAEGIPDFQLLQNAFEGRNQRALHHGASAGALDASIVYYVFDMPFHQGRDLRNLPLLERRAALQQLLKGNPSRHLRFSDAFDAPSRDLVLSACKLGFEGLIGKRSDAVYRSGRSKDWIKLKCGRRQEFVICGFTEPKGSRSGLGALLLGLHDAKGRLAYAGNVGSGFNDQVLDELREQLDRLQTPDSPFEAGTPVAGKPHWVRPVLLAEISFAEWTHGNHVRHAVFRGLRSDKPPERITREKAVKASDIDKPADKPVRTTKKQADARSSSAPHGRSSPEQAGDDPNDKRTGLREKPAHSGKKVASSVLPTSLRVTHPERVIDAQSGVTKLQLIEFYAAVAPLLLPHLKKRPVSLVRAPSGVGGELFFQKHAKEGELQGVNLLDPALDPEHDSLLEISSAAGLLSAAQMNTVEFHTWNAVATSISKPDRMTFDLDPGEGVAWATMQEAALLVRTMLDELGLAAFLKTSGGKGLHVVVPLKKQLGWDAVKDFSHHIVRHLGHTLPQLFVAKSGPSNRVGKIFADYLRNGFGATTASAWTARARPGMGVSVPVSWDELPQLTSGAHWTVLTVSDRLAVGNTPWDDYASSARPLGPAMKVMGFKP